MATPKQPRADRPKLPAERRSGPVKPEQVDLRSEPVTAMRLAEVTHAAKLCFGMAAAILGHGDLDKPNGATFSAAEGLYEGNHVLHRGLGLSSLPINQLLCSVADSADCNANYGIGITATHCHQIAWRYGQCVMDTLNQWNVVGTCEGQVVTDQQHFRQKWPDIQQSLKVLPQIEYAKFLAAFDREAARAQTLLRTSPASATTLPAAPSSEAKPGEPENDARHSLDFASVDWYGTPFTFTTNQAACVRVLWEAWKNKTPVIGGLTIIDAAGVDRSDERLDLVFRDNLAWGTMIVSPSKGRYCLKAPDAAT